MAQMTATTLMEKAVMKPSSTLLMLVALLSVSSCSHALSQPTAGAAMLLPDVRQALVPLEDIAAVGHPTGNYYLLRLQKCKGQKEFTIHGLWWQNGDGCTGPGFNESALEDIEPKMEADWMSCPEYGGDNVGFWSHEWLKHGTCSNLTEHEFFETALNLYESHKDDCSEAAGQCSICFQPDFVQCGAVGTESCICES